MHELIFMYSIKLVKFTITMTNVLLVQKNKKNNILLAYENKQKEYAY